MAECRVIKFFSGLKQIEGSIQFWIGDWLNYGHEKYERGKYEEALVELGYKKKTLENISYVSKSIECSRRRETLTFSHHTEIASLEPIEQTKWLDKAENEQLSVRELREQIRDSQRPETPPLPDSKFDIIYADPPWEYDFSETESRRIENKYSTMSVEELKQLDIPASVKKGSV